MKYTHKIERYITNLFITISDSKQKRISLKQNWWNKTAVWNLINQTRYTHSQRIYSNTDMNSHSQAAFTEPRDI